MERSLEYLQGELSKIRTGRASPALIEEIKVTVYDSKMAIRELGSITVSDSQNLVVSPWDKNLADQIAKAIRESDLDLSPFVDDDLVRVPLPDLTEERRKEMTKRVTNKVEELKSSIRNIRQEAMKDIDKQFEDKEISEDEKFDTKEEVDGIAKEFTDKVEELGENKKKDLLSI
jgi:ribosome recycling factor